MKSEDNRLEQDLRSPYICSKSIEYAYGNRRYRSPNMLQRLKDMARITDEIYKMHGERKIGGWMDSQDACLRLGVRPRTLQTFRDNGTLAYSRIGHKIYYRVEDIQGILPLIQKRKEKQV